MFGSSKAKFSIQSMFVFVAVLLVMLGINLRTSQTSGETFWSIALPPGESNVKYWGRSETGFPFRYHQVTVDVAPGVAETIVAEGGRRIRPKVTHLHWLVANFVFAIGFAAAISRSLHE